MALWSASFVNLVFLLCLLTFLLHQAYGEKYLYEADLQDEDGPNNQSNRCNDLFQGSWVFDDSYPLYDALDCPFINPGLNCLKNGRPDQMYLKYTWKPNGCDLARFDGQDFLQRFRGKKIMFVGDSLSSNQWQSLTCMLHTAVPKSNYTLIQRELLSTFSFPVGIWSFGYVYEIWVSGRPGGGKSRQVLKLDSISRSNQWKGIDILIFNSYHWWMHSGRLQTWDYYRVGDKLAKDMDRMEAYKIAMTTWANWVDSNIDPAKTRVFFQGISAIHNQGKEWNEPKVNNCNGQTKPIEGSNYPGNRYPGEAVVKSVLSNMTKPVYLLDITLLTQLRKDGHPSQYSHGGGIDCSHWCLAGVPDTWNQLLYTILIQK